MTMSSEPPALGVWFDPAILGTAQDCGVRHCRAATAAQAWRDAATGATQLRASHAYFPDRIPCVALCTRVQGRVEAIGSATLLRDGRGPCLVTAAHTLQDPDGTYADALKREGLIALALSGASIFVGTRTWHEYADDVALTPLQEDEATCLGGAVHVPGTPWAGASLWAAFGFPNSGNRQRVRHAPFALHGQRIMLYHRADTPPGARGIAWTMDRTAILDPASGQMSTGKSLKGCSGGLIAGYDPKLGVWLPEAILTEYHQGATALVGTPLSRIFQM